MSPRANTPGAPNNLPPLAASLSAKYAALLRSLPPVLAASLLVEVNNYDWMFPAERRELDEQLIYLSDSPTVETRRILAAFRALPMPAATAEAWIHPKVFLQSFTAHLWQVHATEQFRQCGEAYGTILDTVRGRIAASEARLVIVLVGQGAGRSYTPLFVRLRAHGTYFAHIDDAQAFEEARAILLERANPSHEPYSHWWIDGGHATASSSCPYARLFYAELQPVRAALARCVRNAIAREGMGPEKVRSYMMALQPADLSGFPEQQDTVMQHFAVRVLCDGSGTQNLSTSFVQWSAREALRRAQPTTLLLRFTPRARNVDFLDVTASQGELDAEGALVDADMGAYYTWLNLQRLEKRLPTRFVVIAENGQGAVAIGPGMSAGSTADNPATVRKIVEWMSD